MAVVNLNHPPDDVVILPQRGDDSADLDPRAWVEAIRHAAPRQLRQRVADHLTQARELGEV